MTRSKGKSNSRLMMVKKLKAAAAGSLELEEAELVVGWVSVAVTF